MKSIIITLGLFLCIPILFSNDSSINQISVNSKNNEVTILKENKKLRHVVLFKFKEDVTQENIIRVERAFAELPEKIKEIKEFEWGINNSHENLNKGFTHGFLLTFDSEEGRNRYLPHPAHKSFVEILDPFLEDVLVFDYITN